MRTVLSAVVSGVARFERKREPAIAPCASSELRAREMVDCDRGKNHVEACYGLNHKMREHDTRMG